MHQATLTYNKLLIQRAVLSFWRRSVGIDFIVALLLLAGSLSVLFLAGNRSWLVGSLGAFLVIGVVLAVAVYWIHYGHAIQKFKEMGSPLATFCAETSSFILTSEIGTATFRWSVVKELWQFTDYWLILFSKAQFITIPLADLSSEMQTFILDRVRAAGGKVC